MSTPPTGDVTFHFTYVQGSTRLWERDAKRMQRASVRHDEILKGSVESHGGYVFRQLTPGRYHSDEFEPAASFRVDKGWMTYGEELPDALAMTLGSTGELERPSTFGFYSPSRVVDQSDPDRNTFVPAPESVDGWVEWFQEHPNLDTEQPVPVTVGGASGVQIDAVVTSEPRDSQFSPAFWVLSTDVVFYDFVGARSRTTILNIGETPCL